MRATVYSYRCTLSSFSLQTIKVDETIRTWSWYQRLICASRLTISVWYWLHRLAIISKEQFFKFCSQINLRESLIFLRLGKISCKSPWDDFVFWIFLKILFMPVNPYFFSSRRHCNLKNDLSKSASVILWHSGLNVSWA